MIGQEYGAVEVESLAYDYKPLQSEYALGAVDGVVGASSCEVTDYVLWRHTMAESIIPHALGLVIVVNAIVAGHQKFLDFAGFIETNRGKHPVFEKIAQPAIGIDPGA